LNIGGAGGRPGGGGEAVEVDAIGMTESRYFGVGESDSVGEAGEGVRRGLIRMDEISSSLLSSSLLDDSSSEELLSTGSGDCRRLSSEAERVIRVGVILKRLTTFSPFNNQLSEFDKTKSYLRFCPFSYQLWCWCKCQSH